MTTFNTVNANSNNLHFDLLDYTEGLSVAYVAAHIAQSTAWRIDTMLVSESRKLFRSVREELYQTGGGESLSELTAALHEAEFAEQSFKDAGLTAEGTIETIRALNAQRDQWHDLAAQLTSLTSDWQGMPKRYDAPELESVFYKDVTLKVNAQTQNRLRMSARKHTEAFGGDKTMEETLYQRKLARKEARSAQMAENLKDQSGAVYLMFQMALRSDESSAAVRSKKFYDLPLEAQRMLLTNAASAAGRADEWAADERMSDFEYDLIAGQAIKVQLDIKKLLDGQRFVIAQRVKDMADATV